MYLFLNENKELLDTLEGEFFLFHQDSDRVSHEFLCYLQHVSGHGSRKKNNLGLPGKTPAKTKRLRSDIAEASSIEKHTHTHLKIL